MAMTQEDRQKYQKLYLQTAQDYVTDLERTIGSLIKNPDDKEALEVAHISAHSLASQSNMMNYHSTGALASVIESILKTATDDKNSLQQEVLGMIKETLKELELSLYEIEKNDKERDLSEEIEKLKLLHG